LLWSRSIRAFSVLSAPAFAEEQKQHEQKLSDMLRNLPPDMQGRYVKLAEVCRSIRGNYASSLPLANFCAADGFTPGRSAPRLCRLLSAAFQQRQYVKTLTLTDQKRNRRSAATHGLRSGRVQEINKKRVEILSKRIEKYQKIMENRQVVDAQCSAVKTCSSLCATSPSPCAIRSRSATSLPILFTMSSRPRDRAAGGIDFQRLTPDMEGIMQDAGPPVPLAVRAAYKDWKLAFAIRIGEIALGLFCGESF